MHTRHVAIALVASSLAFLSGCPDGSGFGLGSGDQIIPDGTYLGDSSGNLEVWYGNQLYTQGSGGSESSATFLNGRIVKDTGAALQSGDVEELTLGAFSASRQVYDVYVGEWAYEVDYDVSASWNGIPMTGTEFITFGTNADGSIAMFDTLELTSLESFDGGAWTFHVNASGTLYPTHDVPGAGSPLDNPILDVKSGRAIHADPNTP